MRKRHEAQRKAGGTKTTAQAEGSATTKVATSDVAGETGEQPKPLPANPIDRKGQLVHIRAAAPVSAEDRWPRQDPGCWAQWLALWHSTTQVEFLHSLLEFAFRIPVTLEEWKERILFFFDLADGYGLEIPYDERPERMQHKTVFSTNGMADAEVRRTLKVKAFQKLCLNVFKGRSAVECYGAPGPDEPAWVTLVHHQELLDKALWFFRLNNRLRIANLEAIDCSDAGKNHLELAREVAEAIATTTWTKKYLDSRRQERMHNYVDTIRPTLMRLLFGLGRLDFLLYDKQANSWPKLKEEWLHELQDLLLQQEITLPGGKKGLPGSLDELIFVNSRGAGAVKLLKIRVAEEKRDEQIKAAEEAAAKAAQEVERLQRRTA